MVRKSSDRTTYIGKQRESVLGGSWLLLHTERLHGMSSKQEMLTILYSRGYTAKAIAHYLDTTIEDVADTLLRLGVIKEPPDYTQYPWRHDGKIVCKVCGEPKEEEEYYESNKSKCKECVIAYQMKRHRAKTASANLEQQPKGNPE